jgi:hypothetical protein
MRNFNLFVEEVIQNVTEARIPNRNKFYKINLEVAKEYVDSLSDESSKKTSFLKIAWPGESIILSNIKKKFKYLILLNIL